MVMESCWWSCTLPPGKMKVRFHISRCILDSKDPSAVNVTFRKTGLLMEAVLEYSSKILWQTCCALFLGGHHKVCFHKVCKVPLNHSTLLEYFCKICVKSFNYASVANMLLAVSGRAPQVLF